jgi:hypothetical protein
VILGVIDGLDPTLTVTEGVGVGDGVLDTLGVLEGVKAGNAGTPGINFIL